MTEAVLTDDLAHLMAVEVEHTRLPQMPGGYNVIGGVVGQQTLLSPNGQFTAFGLGFASRREPVMLAERIEQDPDVMRGVPVFQGTRIPVYVVFDYLADGCTVDDLLRDYPLLTRDHVKAAFVYASRILSSTSPLLSCL